MYMCIFSFFSSSFLKIECRGPAEPSAKTNIIKPSAAFSDSLSFSHSHSFLHYIEGAKPAENSKASGKTNHKTSTLERIATPWHSPILGVPIPQGSNPSPSKTPPKSHVAKTIVPQAFPVPEQNPSNCNVKRWRSMEAWKK